MNYSYKTLNKIENLNKEQQAKAQNEFLGMGVTYANLDVRDDLMETSIIEPINTSPGSRGPGARFSNNLLKKSRSPSPEVLAGSKYIQYMAMPGKEAYQPPVAANPQVPVRPPNENIMKIDNFISNLLKVGDDP